jgi:hypothetical protein
MMRTLFVYALNPWMMGVFSGAGGALGSAIVRKYLMKNIRDNLQK